MYRDKYNVAHAHDALQVNANTPSVAASVAKFLPRVTGSIDDTSAELIASALSVWAVTLMPTSSLHRNKSPSVPVFNKKYPVSADMRDRPTIKAFARLLQDGYLPS